LSRQRHIVLIASYLNAVGGYERIVANTVNLFAQKGENITLLLLADTNESVYPLHENVQIVQLPLNFGITPEGNMVTRKIKMLKDLLVLRKMLRLLNPSLLICSEYPHVVAAILTAQRKKMTIISWEHTHFNVNIKNRFWTTLCNLAYPKLDAIVCLNPDEKALFKPYNRNVVVIPNFIQHPENTSDHANKIILTVARLTAVKGIEYLLHTAKLVLLQHPEWKWKLIGDGELKAHVNDFIEKEDLQDKLLLQEFSGHDIDSEYRSASLYVMTSLNECFPMVLLEALSYGLPCISFDCDTGPRHIIKNNFSGLLVEKQNANTLANAITELIENENKRKMMSANALESSKRFAPETIYKMWETLFNDDSSSKR